MFQCLFSIKDYHYKPINKPIKKTDSQNMQTIQSFHHHDSHRGIQLFVTLLIYLFFLLAHQEFRFLQLQLYSQGTVVLFGQWSKPYPSLQTSRNGCCENWYLPLESWMYLNWVLTLVVLMGYLVNSYVYAPQTLYCVHNIKHFIWVEFIPMFFVTHWFGFAKTIPR